MFFYQVIEEAKHLKSTVTQRAQDVQALLSEMDDSNIAESQQKTALEDQCHVALSTICSADRSRQTAAQLASDEEQQATTVSNECCETEVFGAKCTCSSAVSLLLCIAQRFGINTSV